MIAKITKLGDKQEVKREGKKPYNKRNVTVAIGDKEKTYSTWGSHCDALDRFSVGDEIEYDQEANRDPQYPDNMNNPRKPGEPIPEKKQWGGKGGSQSPPESFFVSYCKDVYVANPELKPQEIADMVSLWWRTAKEVTK